WAWHGSDFTLEARFRLRFGGAVHVSSARLPSCAARMQSGAMRVAAEPLPIDPALPELTAALRAAHAAVLVAPPGAGKTTRVPLVLAAEPWAAGKKLLVLEPRRLGVAARGAGLGRAADGTGGASGGC